MQVRGVTFDVKIHEARTGKKLGRGRLEATEDKCPFLTVFEKDDSAVYAHPADEDLVALLERYVRP